MFLLGTIVIVAVIIVVMALMSGDKPKPRKTSGPRRDPPGWGTPHGY